MAPIEVYYTGLDWNFTKEQGLPIRYAFGIALTIVLISTRCASTGQPAGSDVLQPVESTTPNTVPSVQSPTFIRLQEALQKQGYEGVGLTYETEESLALLYRIFSDPRSENRQIRLVYTGLQMAYDKQHESLTIGQNLALEAIVTFIVKNIPLRGK